MTAGDGRSAGSRARREPPRFRVLAVARTERLTERLVRVVVLGSELAGMVVSEPAASVRVLLPGADGLVIPTWNGNEFLLPDGTRPRIRTFTPWQLDNEELTLGVVLHEGGFAASWAEQARPGDPVAVSGPGRGYTLDPDATAFLLLGDETAVPALTQLLDAVGPAVPAEVHVEVVDPEAAFPVSGRDVTWHAMASGAPPGETLVAAVRAAEIGPGTRVWAAGEASAIQRIRRHLYEDRGVPRGHTSVRGYWKQGRAGENDDG